MKRPSFQFYPSDWLRDTALRTCSVGARGLWIDMICFMHEGTPYGHLKVNNKVILPDNLSRMTGETLDNVQGYLKELSEAGVFEYDDDGAIFSRRMVKDENVRNARAEGGKKGGNPALVGNKVNHKVIVEDKQKSTPSSSTSSSSSKITNSPPDGVPDDLWQEWTAMRKKQKAPVTDRVLNSIKKESDKAGITLSEAMQKMIVRGWRGFESEWVATQKQSDEYIPMALR